MSGRNFHILVAEDDHDFSFLIRRIIRKNMPNAIISEVGDGETALNRFLDEGADLILADYRLPRLSGLELIARVRLKDANIPLILISNSPDAEAEAAGHGVNHFLNKAHLLRDLPLFLSLALQVDG